MISEDSYGLKIGSIVECITIEIGEVKKISNLDDGSKKITLTIHNDFFIPDQSEFVIKPKDNNGMMVDIISIESTDFLKRGDEVKGNVSQNLEDWRAKIEAL